MMLMFNMALHFEFIYNPKKIHYDNPNSSSNCVFNL